MMKTGKKKRVAQLAAPKGKPITSFEEKFAQDILKVWKTSHGIPKQFFTDSGAMKFLVYENQSWNFVRGHASGHLDLSYGLETVIRKTDRTGRVLEPIPAAMMFNALMCLKRETEDDKIYKKISRLTRVPDNVSVIVLEYFAIPWATQIKRKGTGKKRRQWFNFYWEKDQVRSCVGSRGKMLE